MISESHTGIVKTIEYKATGSSGESTGVVNLDPPAKNYIPFSELTPSVVQSWVESKNLYNSASIDNASSDDSISTNFPWQ